MTYQSVLNYALKMYGDVMVVYVKSLMRADYENMCFWQEQAYAAARDVASFGADAEVK